MKKMVLLLMLLQAMVVSAIGIKELRRRVQRNLMELTEEQMRSNLELKEILAFQELLQAYKKSHGYRDHVAFLVLAKERKKGEEELQRQKAWYNFCQNVAQQCRDQHEKAREDFLKQQLLTKSKEE
ncbi:hypothetical protein HYV11_01965 [Candidatus Dependentiae bacterium]|nr:hypothetical protein [Candidatus Dependentiae bacterium]